MEGEIDIGRHQVPPARDARSAGPLRRLVPLVREYVRYVVLGVAATTVTLLAQVATPKVFEAFIDDAVTAGRRDLVLPYALLALALAGIAAGAAFARRNASGTIGTGVEADLRNRLYAHLQRLPISFHDGWQSGQLVSRAVSDISRIRRFLGFGVLYLFTLGQLFVWVLILMFRLDATLALVTVAFTLPIAWLGHGYSRRYRALSRRSQQEQGDLASIAEESAVGVRVIKSFGRMPQRSEMYRRQAETLLGTNVSQAGLRANVWAVPSRLALGLNLVVIVLLGGMRVIDDAMTLGGLAAFVMYHAMLVWPVRDVGWVIANAQDAHAAAERVWEILDVEPEIADLPGARSLPSAEGHVSLEGVVFAYPGTSRQVLDGVDLEMHPGETLALVGMTGAGKSTVTSLVPRFYDPQLGRVTLDGHDLRDLRLDSVRGHVGVAFEDPILFSASVRENLLMGRPDATDDELWDALRAAQAEAFVRNLPYGLDTRVGEQGYSLSGGQRQRLALARAVVGRPRVLVLDNPMSSVDVHTEAAIEEALKAILVGRTALLVAHRPSTLLLADRVALLSAGRVVATGTHHDLLTDVPLYREVLAKDMQDPLGEAEGVMV